MPQGTFMAAVTQGFSERPVPFGSAAEKAKQDTLRNLKRSQLPIVRQVNQVPLLQ